MAARYAKAPSYSQMQVEEARVAVRAAEIATKVALDAQAVAESALAEMHAASQEQPSLRQAVVQTIAQPARTPEPAMGPVPHPDQPRVVETAIPPVQLQTAPVRDALPAPPPQTAVSQTEPAVERQSYGIRWDPDLPMGTFERKPQPHRRAQEAFELSAEDWWSPAEVTEDLRNNPIEVGEAESAHANLIQFPRELVATRRMRPRLAEPSSGSVPDAEHQLSIFEVDPGAISTEAPAPAAGQEPPASIWNLPEWSRMRFDNQPVDVLPSAYNSDPRRESLPVASMGVRLMAAVVDGSLILAAFVTAGFVAARNFQHPPTGKPAELLGLVALAVIGLLYYAFFFTLPVSTPGMKYAQIGLCTFDDESPNARPVAAQARRHGSIAAAGRPRAGLVHLRRRTLELARPLFADVFAQALIISASVKSRFARAF